MQPAANSKIIGQLNELGPFADDKPASAVLSAMLGAKLSLGKREAVRDALPRRALQTVRGRAKSRASWRSVCQ